MDNNVDLNNLTQEQLADGLQWAKENANLHTMTPEEMLMAQEYDRKRRRNPKYIAKKVFGFLFGSVIIPVTLFLMCLSMFWRILG